MDIDCRMISAMVSIHQSFQQINFAKCLWKCQTRQLHLHHMKNCTRYKYLSHIVHKHDVILKTQTKQVYCMDNFMVSQAYEQCFHAECKTDLTGCVACNADGCTECDDAYTLDGTDCSSK